MRQLKISKQITRKDDETVSRYFQEINRYPTIPAEEEVELCISIKRGDKDALEKLIVANLRFVISVAKQYQNQGLSFPDLINEGNIGLIKAANKYDETKGFKFISYAVWWIRQSIIQAITQNARTVCLPSNRVYAINRISKATMFLEQKYERDPSDSEIAEYLNMNKKDVMLTNDIKKRPVSLDTPVTVQDEEFNIADVIYAEGIPPPDNRMMQESLTINVRMALQSLSKQEADIITMAFGLDDSPKYQVPDIAEKLNISVERVRQMKRISLFKLKKVMKTHFAFFATN